MGVTASTETLRVIPVASSCIVVSSEEFAKQEKCLCRLALEVPEEEMPDEIDDLINAESECGSDTSGCSSGSDDGHEAGAAAPTASCGGWSCMNNHDVGPNISIPIQNIESRPKFPRHFDIRVGGKTKCVTAILPLLNEWFDSTEGNMGGRKETTIEERNLIVNLALKDGPGKGHTAVITEIEDCRNDLEKWALKAKR
ncbi:hypothetical protein C0J52_05597 [Blattella germanica]|nr:hypothetical protein C0J52_05597 [Blattella germanica]